MATHDYVIDNQSAPALRADLNSVLQAIVSTNAATTAPAVTYANMLWYDTTDNQLKKRNEANSGWIVVGTFDEGTGTFTPSGERALATQVQAEAGTDNTTTMTPLRVAQAIDVQVDTATVLGATAGAAVGAVGSYAWLGRTTATTFVAGTTYAGSSLLYAGTLSTDAFSDNTAASIAGATPSGTWRAMGSANAGTGRAPTTMFLRIS